MLFIAGCRAGAAVRRRSETGPAGRRVQLTPPPTITN